MPTERSLAETFVELADNLVADFDIVDFLHTLADRSAELFDAAEAAVVLADQRGGLKVVSTSGQGAMSVELFEIQAEQGPAVECCETGQPVNVEDLMLETRWPQFTAQAATAGFRAAYSLPLRFRAEVIGALNLFLAEPVRLKDTDLIAAQAMADIATISVLQEKALREARVLAEQLQRALNSRVVIEQAKGVLAERSQVGLEEAFSMLRSYARNHNRRLHDVAIAVISSLISVQDLQSSASKNSSPSRRSRG